MVQAWVASPGIATGWRAERGRVRVAFKATNAAARQIQPLTFILSPSPRGEATSHPRELILILRDFQMMSLAARITRLWTTEPRKRSGNRRAARESRECTRIGTGTSAQFREALGMRLAVASRFGSNPARGRKATRDPWDIVT